jgi:hypothetical protein
MKFQLSDAMADLQEKILENAFEADVWDNFANYPTCKFISSSIYFTKNKKFQLCYFQPMTKQWVNGQNFIRIEPGQVRVVVPIDSVRFLSEEFIYDIQCCRREGYLYTINLRQKFKTQAHVTKDYDWCEAPAKLKYLEGLK